MKKNENVIWQKNKVSYEDRCRVLGQQGKVVWFTGLSGSGKSTIAVELEKMLNEAGKAVYLLDGDNIRCGINSDLGFPMRTETKISAGLEKSLRCSVMPESLHSFRLFLHFVRCAASQESAPAKEILSKCM